MFDPFGCNEVGLAEGPSNSGTACLMRFKTIHDMVRRILHNKSKRHEGASYKFTRFVLSSCVATRIPPVPYPWKKAKKKPMKAEWGESTTTDVEDETETDKVSDKENIVG